MRSPTLHHQAAVHGANRISGPVAVCVFGFLLWSRMGVGRDVPGQTVFGDTGDGWFNLWILEHLRLNLLQGWAALSDGRILHPATATFWYSDNLLTLSPPYLLLRGLGWTRLAAVYGTSVFWMVAAFASGWWLFSEVRRSAVEDAEKAPGAWLPPWLSLAVVVAMPARIMGVQHFQNHALVYVILLSAFALVNLRTRSCASFFAMGACQFALVASAPYYALLGMMVLMGWCIGFFLPSSFDMRRMWERCAVCALPWGLACIPFALAYHRTGTPEYAREELVRQAWRWTDLLSPALGGRVQAYGGLWFTILVAGSILIFLWAFSLKWRTKPFRIAVLLVALWAFSSLKVKEIYLITSGLRLVVQISAVVCLVVWAGRSGRVWARTVLGLGLGGVFILGVAMGPETFYGERGIDPSIWSMLHTVLPGVGSMRGLLRIMPAGAVMIVAAVFALAVAWGRRMRLIVWNGIALVIVVISLVELRSLEAPRMKVNPQELSFTSEQQNAFAQLAGVMVEVPAAPSHRNTGAMLRWQPFRDLRLVNGYTGRRTDAFDAVISAENHHGRGSPEQMEAAQAASADWLCIRRAWVPNEVEESLAARYPEVYRDDRFQVLDLRDRSEEF
jgi:hypothetical protein